MILILMKKLKIKNFIVPLIFAVVLFVACMFGNGGLFGEEQYRAKTVIDGLANCFTIPGVILAGVGGISWAAKFGTFDMLGYGSRSFFGIFIRPLAEDLPRTFYDYRKAKEEKGRVWLVELFWTGIVFLALGLIFTVVSLIVN